nr:gallinacin-10-like [Chrysemys picta bellii]
MKILYLLFAVVLLLFQAAPEARIPSCRFLGGYCIRPRQRCPSGRFLNGPCGFRERCCKR